MSVSDRLPDNNWRRCAGSSGLRHLLTLGLVLGLVVFGLEVAVHSSHHLSEQDTAAHCVIAAVFSHVVADGSADRAVDCPLIWVGESQVGPDWLQVDVRPQPLRQGRAPPAARF